MSEQVTGSEPGPGEAVLRRALAPKNRGKRVAAAAARSGELSGGQVSLTLPREIIQAYDAISRETGVNRAHLMREALGLYAALLATGQRVYQIPGRRVA